MLSCVLKFQSPDGHYIACGAIDGIINIFDLTTGKLLHTLEGKKGMIDFLLLFVPVHSTDLIICKCSDFSVAVYTYCWQVKQTTAQV